MEEAEEQVTNCTTQEKRLGGGGIAALPDMEEELAARIRERGHRMCE